MLNETQPDIQSDDQVLALAPVLERIKAFATGLVIRTREQFAEAGERLKSIKGALKTIEDARERVKQPILLAGREIDAQAKLASEPYVLEERVIKLALEIYLTEQDRIRQEEQRKLNEAAERERQKLLEQARKAEAKGKTEKADELQDRAAMVAVVAREVPKVKGVTRQKFWNHRIVDEGLIPREYMVLDDTKIRKVVKAMGKHTNIPGVEVFEDSRISASAS